MSHGSAGSVLFFCFSRRRRHTRFSRDWSSDVCSSDLPDGGQWQALRRRLAGGHGRRGLAPPPGPAPPAVARVQADLRPARRLLLAPAPLTLPEPAAPSRARDARRLLAGGAVGQLAEDVGVA